MLGHRAVSCPSPPLCSVCLKCGHHFGDCPLVVHGGNILFVCAFRRSTYADVAKVVSVPHLSPADAPAPVLKESAVPVGKS